MHKFIRALETEADVSIRVLKEFLSRRRVEEFGNYVNEEEEVEQKDKMEAGDAAIRRGAPHFFALRTILCCEVDFDEPEEEDPEQGILGRLVDALGERPLRFSPERLEIRDCTNFFDEDLDLFEVCEGLEVVWDGIEVKRDSMSWESGSYYSDDSEDTWWD
ncbi:hypothetical protein H1R20_g7353, partial [Candolleomyces eurysporus]